MTEEGAWLLTPRPEAYEAAGSDLDSSLVALVLAGLPDHEHTYQHSWERAYAAVGSGEAQAAVLLRPVTRGPDRRVGRRPPADAAQDDLLQPQAPHRDGVPLASTWAKPAPTTTSRAPVRDMRAPAPRGPGHAVAQRRTRT